MKNNLCVISLLFCSSIFSHQACAVIVNGSFENGLIGWTVVGDVSQSSAFSTDGQSSALLTPSTSISEIEMSLGIDSGTLDLITDDGSVGGPTNGSAIFQTINVSAGSTITFDFNFDNTETPFVSASFNDTAIALFQNGLLNGFFLGSSFATDDNIGTGIFTPLVSGEAVLSFIVFNQGDEIIDPFLFVDNVQVSAVPLPASFMLFLSALSGTVFFRKC